MKKILMLGKLPPPYMGPSIATEIILNSTLKNNFHLLYIDTRANESLNTLGKWSLKKVLKNNAIYFQHYKAVKNEKPELVWVPISQTTIGFIKDSVFILIARLFRKKVVLHLRGSDFKNWIDNRASLFTRWYVKRILKSTQGMIVLGDKLRYLFTDYYPEKKIFVVPNGADFKLQLNHTTEKETINLLYLANLQPSKGIEDVMEAMIILKNKYQQKFIFTVVGAWRKEEIKQKCLSMVKQNEIPVQFFAPQIDDAKFKLLSEADVFIFTPREPEGHPWVIVEAMASGLPIISTDQGAITESVIDGQNGFIVRPKSPEQIAEKINELIVNAEMRKKMGEESRKLYENNFTEARMVERFTTVFNNILNEN